MTDCPNGDVRDALPEYLHDRLEPARRAEVESHLASCEACRAELALLRDLRTAMRRAPAVDVAAIAAAIRPHRAPLRRTRVSGWRVAAAIVAVAVGGTSIALLRSRPPVPAELTQAVRAESTTSRDVRPIAAAGSGASNPVAAGPVPAAPAPSRSPSVQGATPETASRELAMASGTIGELSDGELSALVEQIDSFDALPSTEVESVAPLSTGTQEEL